MQKVSSHRTRLAFAILSSAFLLGFFLIASLRQQIIDDTEKIVRKGSSIEAWEALKESELSKWEQRQIETPTLVSSPSEVGHVAFLDNTGLHFPGVRRELASQLDLSELNDAVDFARQGKFLKALDIYRRRLERGSVTQQIEGMFPYLIAWLRTIELLAHLDLRSSLLESIELGARDVLAEPQVFQAADIAQVVQVLFRILRRNERADKHPTLSSEALLQATRRVDKTFERLRMLVKALQARDAWAQSILAHLPSLQNHKAIKSTGRYGFLSYFGQAPVVNVLYRNRGRRLIYSLDPSALMNTTILPKSLGLVFSISFERNLLASLSTEGLVGQSQQIALDRYLPGLNLHLIAGDFSNAPKRSVLSPYRHPARINKVSLDLAKARYEEFGKGNRRLALELYKHVRSQLSASDPRCAAIQKGILRCR